eukprot:COSAG01_NODE_193_length_22433_cov_91.669114_7_plen_73_part_00
MPGAQPSVRARMTRVFGEGERQGGNEPVTVQFQKRVGAGKEKKHRGNLKVHLELLPLALVRADSADMTAAAP